MTQNLRTSWQPQPQNMSKFLEQWAWLINIEIFRTASLKKVCHNKILVEKQTNLIMISYFDPDGHKPFPSDMPRDQKLQRRYHSALASFCLLSDTLNINNSEDKLKVTFTVTYIHTPRKKKQRELKPKINPLWNRKMGKIYTNQSVEKVRWVVHSQ